nr:Hypothetical protein [Providencia rettgeri]
MGFDSYPMGIQLSLITLEVVLWRFPQELFVLICFSKNF